MGGHRHFEHVLHDECVLTDSRPRGLFGWDARVKLALVAAAIILNTWVAIPRLSALTLAVGIVLLAWSRPPARPVLTFLLVPLWPVLLVLGGFSLAFGATPIYHLGSLTFYHEGLLRGGEVALRAYCDVTWLMTCVLTTPVAAIFRAMRWYRVPEVLVDTLAMMYRYSFLLYAEFRRMRLAARSRGGQGAYRTEMKTLSRIAAQIFMRAFDRSERIYLAMVARGGERYD